MQAIARCPSCHQVVDTDQRTCPFCATRLTRAKFKFPSVLLYGACAILLAFIVSLIIVPLAVLAVIIALFARKKLHVVNFENPPDDDNDVPRSKGRVVDIPNTG